VRKQGQEFSKYGTVQTNERNSMMTREKLIHHVEHLKEKHDRIDKEIIELELHHTDHLKVESLKKLKLKLKDEIVATNKKIDNIQ
jgi:uncharacterized protein YdcH (DUF465 family)